MLVRRGKTYYSRLWVPVDLRELFGCRELVRSLHTTDRRTAKATAKVVEGEIETLFQVVRSGMLTGSQINSMIERHRERKLEGLSAARRQHGPKVYLPPPLQSVPVDQLIAKVVIPVKSTNCCSCSSVISLNVCSNQCKRIIILKPCDELTTLAWLIYRGPPIFYKRF